MNINFLNVKVFKYENKMVSWSFVSLGLIAAAIGYFNIISSNSEFNLGLMIAGGLAAVYGLIERKKF